MEPLDGFAPAEKAVGLGGRFEARRLVLLRDLQHFLCLPRAFEMRQQRENFCGQVRAERLHRQRAGDEKAPDFRG